MLAAERALARHRPLGGAEQEFLDLLTAARAAPAAHFSQAWRDPASYWFGRLTYELVGAILQEVVPTGGARQRLEALAASPPAAFERHLEDFKRWILSLDALGRGTRHFAKTWRTRLPIALPGTPWTIVGTDGDDCEVEILGTRDGWPVVRSAAAGSERVLSPIASDTCTTLGPRLIACPVVRSGDVEIRVQVEAIRFAGLPFATDCADVSPDFAVAHAPTVQAAIAWLAQIEPTMLAHLEDAIEVIALKPPTSGSFSNASSSELPGAMVLSATPDPLLLADAIVHELAHGRLFDLEERGAFFADDPQHWLGSAEHYSPWRDDPRPLHGILHGAAVYAAVARFWLAGLERDRLSGRYVDFACDQIVRIPLQIRLGLAQVEWSGCLTETGRALIAELREEALRITARAATLAIPDDVPAIEPSDLGGSRPLDAAESAGSVRTSVARHLTQYDLGRRCHELARQLRIPVDQPAR